MLMIRAIYSKWVIISGRLYLVMVMRALTDILPSGNRWRWWATEVCYHCALPFSPCVSPPHRHFTSLSFGSIYESQVRSSQVLPFCRTTACLGILKEGSGNVLVTQSLLCFFFHFFYWIMKNLWWQLDLVYHFQQGSCSACLRYSAALECLVSLGSWQGAKHAVRCSARPNHSFDSSKKIWWLKFIFDTVIIKLLKTIKTLPTPPFS